MSMEKPARRWTKWVVRILVGILAVVVLLVVIAAALLATGWPQRTVLTKVLTERLSDRLGPVDRIEMTGLGTVGQIKLTDLKAFGPGAAGPKLDVSGVDMPYEIMPKDKRYFPSLKIDQVDVTLDRSQPAAKPQAGPAHQKRAAPKAPGKKKAEWDPTPYIPRTVDIAKLDATVNYPAYGLAIDGLHVKASIDGTNRYIVNVDGDALAGSWWMGVQSAAKHFQGGMVKVGYDRGHGPEKADPLEIVIPDLLEVSGAAMFKGGGKSEVDVRLDKCVAQNVDVYGAPEGALSMPFAFKKVDLSGTHIKGSVDSGALKATFADTTLSALANGLSIGPKGREIYQGDFTLKGSSGTAQDVDLSLEATLNRNQRIQGKIAGKALDLAVHLGLENWSRDDVVAVLPKDVQEDLGPLTSFQGLTSAALEVAFKNMMLELTGSLKPALVVDGTPVPLELSMTSKASGLVVAVGGDVDAQLRAQLGDGSITAASKLTLPPRMGNVALPPGSKRIKAALTLDKVDPGQWLRALGAQHMLASLQTRVGGTVDMDASQDMQDIKAVLDLTTGSLQYLGFSAAGIENLKLKGDVAASREPNWSVTGSNLAMQLGDWAGVTLKDFSVPVESFNAKGDLSASVDLDLLAVAAQMAGLHGKIKLHAPVQNDQGVTTANLDLAAEGLGYGDLALPAAVPLAVKGAVSYDNSNRRGGVNNLEATLGEGTRLQCAAAQVTAPPLHIEAPFTLTTDCQALVAAGLLSSAKGTGSVTGVYTREQGRCASPVEIKLDAESLVLPHAWAGLSGLAFHVAGNWACDAPLAGSGEFQASKLVVAGITVSDLKGPVQLERDAITSGGLDGAVLDGSVSLAVDAGVLHSGLPAKLVANLKDINLETLTRQLAVPSVSLTGKATGELTLAADMGGVRDLRLTAQSNGPISVNVGFLKELLASQFVKQFAGKQQLEKVLTEVAGTEEQRPFDSAKLTLTLEGDRLAGQVAFESAKLNLTIDLQIDAPVLLQAIQVLQNAQISAVMH